MDLLNEDQSVRATARDRRKMFNIKQMRAN